PLPLQERLQALAAPSHVSLACLIAAGAAAILAPHQRARPSRFLGSFPLLGTHFAPLAELYLPLLLCLFMAVTHHALVWRHDVSQLVVPYLAAAAVACMSREFLRLPLRALAVAFLALGNVHLINVLVVMPYLSGGGLSPNHVVCLGLLLTLLQGSLARRVVRRPGVQTFVLWANLFLAGAILALLALHYVAHPNLQAITTMRFVVSGALAYGAGLYFRLAARTELEPFRRFGYQLEGCYHFGLSLALWCTALLVPQLRHPGTALIALGIAPLYFYLRAEYSAREAGGELSEIGRR
ncbi:MAG TPA: hypothetical protein DEA08_25605, partial [Planctomycetes bacterium]|nr:hypothetical protein [Planctomycetota bacterium]